MIDLRSDTITRPSPAMREAIAEAIVGDDVYHDDPTVNELEHTVASLLGKEDAVFVPTGTMANQIAVRCQTEPGDVIIAHEDSHIQRHELGGAAHNSGVTIETLSGRFGTFTAQQIHDVVPKPHAALPSHLFAPVTLICAENTHMESGGTIWDRDLTSQVVGAAHDLGLRTHLDGARLWNASAATGVSHADLANGFDTVSVCFSKGLGAPVGSALAGSAPTIARARRFKQIFGGGFRQAGLLAAAALYALENNRQRLTDDHGSARRFAESIDESPAISVDLDSVQTNMVYFHVPDAVEFAAGCLAEGVSMLDTGPTTIRAVFHLDVTEAEAAKAAEIIKSLKAAGSQERSEAMR